MSLAGLLARYGYLAILVGAFLEGETVLVLGGFAAHRGYLELPGVIAAAFVGTLAGDQLYFQLGRRGGPALLARRPRWRAGAARAQRLLRRHETGLILGFRFLYGIRTVTPFLLGMSGVSAARFAVLNALSAALWATAVGLAGWMVGAAAQAVLGRLARYEAWIFAVIALAGGLVWVGHWLRTRAS